MEASEPKWVNSNYIQYGVNSLRLGNVNIPGLLDGLLEWLELLDLFERSFLLVCGDTISTSKGLPCKTKQNFNWILMVNWGPPRKSGLTPKTIQRRGSYISYAIIQSPQ